MKVRRRGFLASLLAAPLAVPALIKGAPKPKPAPKIPASDVIDPGFFYADLNLSGSFSPACSCWDPECTCHAKGLKKTE